MNEEQVPPHAPQTRAGCQKLEGPVTCVMYSWPRQSRRGAARTSPRITQLPSRPGSHSDYTLSVDLTLAQISRSRTLKWSGSMCWHWRPAPTTCIRHDTIPLPHATSHPSSRLSLHSGRCCPRLLVLWLSLSHATLHIFLALMDASSWPSLSWPLVLLPCVASSTRGVTMALPCPGCD